MQNSQVGDLLVASTLVEGTILNQGVCLLVYEDEESAIGLMLNRPMQPAQVGQLPAPPSDDDQPTNRLSGQKPNTSPGPSPESMVALVGPGQDPAAGKLIAANQLHFGGPLSGPVVAVHGSADLAEAEAGQGVFVAAQRENLEALMQSEPSQIFRLIVGHLGWTQQQLDNEIEQGVWHRIPATSDILATDDANMWQTLIRRATSNSMARWLGATDNPMAHELN